MQLREAHLVRVHLGSDYVEVPAQGQRRLGGRQGFRVYLNGFLSDFLLCPHDGFFQFLVSLVDRTNVHIHLGALYRGSTFQLQGASPTK